MLNTLYNYEADSLFELVPALDGTFTYHEIMQFDIDQYYKNFVTAELKWRLLDSFLPFIQCNNIHLEDDFEKTLNNFFNYSVRYAFFDGEELREIFKTAVKYKISAIFQPVELLNLHFFTNNYIITKAELFIKKDYFFDNSIGSDIARSFFNQFNNDDNLELINRSDFRKFINNYSSLLIENPSKTASNLDFIRKYLADFSLQLNILNISNLLNDLNINYVADKLRINFKDDYIPTNEVIINYLENSDVSNNDINEALDDILNINDEENHFQPPIEQEVLSFNKRSIFESDKSLDILDNILDEVTNLTTEEIDKNIDNNIEAELELNENVNKYDEFNNVSVIEPSIDLSENASLVQADVEESKLYEINNEKDLDDAINSELKSIMDIINL